MMVIALRHGDDGVVSTFICYHSRQIYRRRRRTQANSTDDIEDDSTYSSSSQILFGIDPIHNSVHQRQVSNNHVQRHHRHQLSSLELALGKSGKAKSESNSKLRCITERETIYYYTDTIGIRTPYPTRSNDVMTFLFQNLIFICDYGEQNINQLPTPSKFQ